MINLNDVQTISCRGLIEPGSTIINKDVRNSYAGIAQLAERNLAKVQVDGSNPFSRSNNALKFEGIVLYENYMRTFGSITILDTETYTPVRQLTLDGVAIDVKWSPEAMQDLFAQMGDEQGKEIVTEMFLAMQEEVQREFKDLTPEEIAQLKEVLV